MKQFPSVVKRRTHTKGHGISQEFPLPPGPTVEIDAETWLDSPPPIPPWQMASFLRKYLNWAGEYAYIASRYKGADAWENWTVPVRYANGPMNADVETILIRLYDGKFIAPRSNGPVPGAQYTAPYKPEDSGIIESAIPEWTIDFEENQSVGSDSFLSDWTILLDGGFVLVHAVYPGGTMRVEHLDGSVTNVEYPENGLSYTPGAYTAGHENVSVASFIYAVTHGKVVLPAFVSFPLSGDTPCPAGTCDNDWLRLLEGIAGRAIWQMVWLEYELMLDDLLGRNLGGRGGQVEGPKSGPINPPPPPPPGPLPHPAGSSWWQNLDQWIGDNAPEIVVTVIEALL